MVALVRDLMAEPLWVPADATLVEAARLMRDADIGDVIIADQGRAAGLVTDRDIVVRAIAEECLAGETTVGDVCTRDLVTIDPDEPVEQAVMLMRQAAVRRLPVVQDGRLVGVISLGDLSIDLDVNPALAEISAAEPNS